MLCFRVWSLSMFQGVEFEYALNRLWSLSMFGMFQAVWFEY